MRYLVYSVRYSVVPINSSLLTVTLYYSVMTAPVYNDTKYSVPCLFVCTTTHPSLKAYCAILVRRSNFRYQASPRLSPRESTQRRHRARAPSCGTWNCGREMSCNFAEITASTPFLGIFYMP